MVFVFPPSEVGLCLQLTVYLNRLGSVSKDCCAVFVWIIGRNEPFDFNLNNKVMISCCNSSSIEGVGIVIHVGRKLTVLLTISFL